MPEPEADVYSLNRPFHLSAGHGLGLVRHVRGLRRRIDVDGHNTRELLQSPRHSLGSEMAQDPVGPECGLGFRRRGRRARHPFTAHACVVGTRRRVRITM